MQVQLGPSQAFILQIARKILKSSVKMTMIALKMGYASLQECLHNVIAILVSKVLTASGQLK